MLDVNQRAESVEGAHRNSSAQWHKLQGEELVLSVQLWFYLDESVQWGDEGRRIVN